MEQTVPVCLLQMVKPDPHCWEDAAGLEHKAANRVKFAQIDISQGKDAMTDRTKRWISLATTALSAAGVGLLMVQLGLHWVTICGSSAYSLAMSVLGVAIAFVAAASLPKRPSQQALSAFALFTIGLSAIASDAMDAALTLSSGWATVSIACGFALPAAFVALTVLSSMCWGRSITVRMTAAGSIPMKPTVQMSASCVGIASAGIMLIHSYFQFPAFVLPVAACVLGTVFSLRFDSATDAILSTPKQPAGGAAAAEIVMALSGGLIVHAIFRLFGSLFPVNILSVTVSLIAASLAISALAWVPLKKTAIQVFAVLALLCPVVFYESLAEFNLWINANIANAWLSTLLRSLQPAAAVVALWVLFRTTQHLHQASEANSEAPNVLFSTAMQSTLAFLCCGLALGLMSVAFGSGVRIEWAIGISLISISAFSQISKATSKGRDFILPATVTAGACLLLAVSSLPMAETSRLLFTGRSANAYRGGMELDVILESDSHRLLEELTTDAGEVTVWRTEGDQIEIRIDGFPSGQLSDNTATSPVPQADALTSILPLVIHDGPEDVMLMGDNVGVGVKICQNFPVPSVKAFQSAPGFSDIAGRYLWKQTRNELNDDPRFEFIDMPIPLATRQKSPEGGFDVVISASPNPILSQRLPELQAEHYRRIRSLMAEDGIYCQRISQYDLGAESVVHLMSTIRQEFPSVIVIQAVPGELVLLATASERALLDERLLSRLQKTHVKKQLALSGLDWSQVAALPVIQTTGVFNVFDHIEEASARSSQCAQLAFSLPLEASRWADKASELKAAFAPHQLRIVDAAPRSDAFSEYARRFTAVIQEGEIVTAFPDNPWPYRKSLKMEMQRNPRPPIEDYVDGRVVRTEDPADKLRKDYFIQLGKLLTQAKMGFTNPSDVRKFQAIISTHEPLLTWFAHHELVRIFEATGSLSPAQELRSRLYTIHFASVDDSGIHQVAAALEQLVKQPNLIPDVDRRYDHANALLQELVRRWELRRNHDPTSAVQAQNDVDRCVQVARNTLEAMEEWAPEVNVSKERFGARRRFIHHSLVTPLRKYSDVVLAHRMKTEPPTLADQDWSPEGSDTDEGDLPMLMAPGAAATN